MPRTKTKKRYNTSRVRQQKALRSLGPVALVWAIAKSMPRASRGEILQACDDAGINRLTAAGQVQQFLHMRDMMHAEQSQSRASTRRTTRAARGSSARGRQTHRAITVYKEPEVTRRAGSKTTSRRTSDREVRA